MLHPFGRALQRLDHRIILKARKVLAGSVHPSPLIYSHYISQRTGKKVFLKLESLQETGSFKIRGAFNKLCSLSEKARRRGVIAASAGNHGQGVAWSARKLGMEALIVMPERAPLKKVQAVREYGAKVELFGASYEEAYHHALELSRSSGKVMIHAFDDPEIIAGQGTVALEILEVVPDVESFIVPVGGGGLISGIALAARKQRPAIEIIGVQASQAASIASENNEGGSGYTLADGIAVKHPGKITLPLINRWVDRMVAVSEEEIAGAILTFLERKNLVVEGAGAVPLAALVEGKARPKGDICVLVISGGNIDINMIDRIIQKGSVRLGRLLRIKVDLVDVPGSLYRLAGIIAEEKANILHIFHDRLSIDNPLNVSRVELNLETEGREHAERIISRLLKEGYNTRITD